MLKRKSQEIKYELKEKGSKALNGFMDEIKTSINGLELSDLTTEEEENVPEGGKYTLKDIKTCIKRVYIHKTIHTRLIYGIFWTALACLLYGLVYDTQSARENYFAVSNIRSALVDTKDYKSLDFAEIGNTEDFYEV